MSRGSDALPDMILVLLVLSALVSIAVIFLIIDFIQRMIGGTATKDASYPTSMFGAPAPGWWVENYERWLYRLEDRTGANFTSSPEGLFKGSMLLAGLVGGGLGLITAIFSALALDFLAFFPAFFIVFLPVLLICGLSAWLLSKPVPHWYQSLRDDDDDDDDDDEPGGFILGRRLD